MIIVNSNLLIQDVGVDETSPSPGHWKPQSKLIIDGLVAPEMKFLLNLHITLFSGG